MDYENLITITVDKNLRTLTVPNNGAVFGVVGDMSVNRICFSVPRYYSCFDMSEFTPRINYANSNGAANYYEADDLKSDENTVKFTWLLSPDVTTYIGNVKFSVQLYKKEANRVVQNFNTCYANGKVLDGFIAENYVTPEQQETLLDKLAAQVTANIDEYLENSLVGAKDDLKVEADKYQKIITDSEKAMIDFVNSSKNDISKAATETKEEIIKEIASDENVEQINKNATNIDSLKEDLGSLLHRPKEYWTMGDIDVPITGEWSNKQVKCEVDLSDMVGNVLKVSVGSISDNIDTHKCFINLLDDQDINLSDGHVLEDTFPNHVITANGGYVTFDVSSIKNNVKYIKIQAQAYSGTKPTITGTIKYSDISAKDVSDKIAFIAEVNKSNLSNNLKNELHLSDSNGAVIKNVGTVNPDTTVTITSNNIKKNKTLIVNAKINSFEKITVGHGIDVYGGAYLEVTPSELSVYNYSTQAKLVKTVSHSLTIANDIYIEVTNSVSKYGFHARIKIVSQGQSFVQSGIFDFPWTGSNGDVFIKTGTNTALSDCKVSWSCSDLSANIHAFGDSYFDYWNPKIADLGYSDKFLFDGFGGRKTLQAIEPLKFCLEHGTPKYVLWCLGMNNPDIDTVNSDWLNGFNTVILACKNKGIIPIFTTIPNTPKNNNSYKNAYIKSSGYRYVDIAHYVGADTANSNWYDGLLSPDKIHPTDKGAYIIAQNIITDLADIMFGN